MPRRSTSSSRANNGAADMQFVMPVQLLGTDPHFMPAASPNGLSDLDDSSSLRQHLDCCFRIIRLAGMPDQVKPPLHRVAGGRRFPQEPSHPPTETPAVLQPDELGTARLAHIESYVVGPDRSRFAVVSGIQPQPNTDTPPKMYVVLVPGLWQEPPPPRRQETPIASAERPL